MDNKSLNLNTPESPQASTENVGSKPENELNIQQPANDQEQIQPPENEVGKTNINKREVSNSTNEININQILQAINDIKDIEKNGYKNCKPLSDHHVEHFKKFPGVKFIEHDNKPVAIEYKGVKVMFFDGYAIAVDGSDVGKISQELLGPNYSASPVLECIKDENGEIILNPNSSNEYTRSACQKLNEAKNECFIAKNSGDNDFRELLRKLNEKSNEAHALKEKLDRCNIGQDINNPNLLVNLCKSVKDVIIKDTVKGAELKGDILTETSEDILAKTIKDYNYLTGQNLTVNDGLRKFLGDEVINNTATSAAAQHPQDAPTTTTGAPTAAPVKNPS